MGTVLEGGEVVLLDAGDGGGGRWSKTPSRGEGPKIVSY